MVRKKKLAKNIFVFALAMCMILTSVQPTISVRADETSAADAGDTSNDDSSAGSTDLTDGDAGGSEEGDSTEISDDSASTSTDGEDGSDEEDASDSSDSEGGDSDSGNDESASDEDGTDSGASAEDGSEDGSSTDGTDESGSDTDSEVAAALDDNETGTTDTTGVSAVMLTASENSYDLSEGAVTINADGTYTISGTYPASSDSESDIETVADENVEVTYPVITVKSGVTANITLNNVSITVEGETGVHRTAIYIEDGAAVTLTLEGKNIITGDGLPDITKNASTDVIGIWIGGEPSDSSASNGNTSLTINGSGSLSINEVGTGISNTATNSLTISGATVTMNNIYMLDSTVSGMGIYNNGTLKVCNGATLSISNVNNDNLSGTYISYKNGYGIASQNEGGVEITGEGTAVSINSAYLSGIYCSDKTDSTTDNYLTVSDGAQLLIDGGSTSTASQHAGIKMESNGTISVTEGASIDISSTIYGIAVNANCLVEVDGVESQIKIHDLATHGTKQNAEQGIYAGANTIINVKNEGNLSVEGANYAIVFEVGNSGEDGVFVTEDGKLDIADSNLGIYVQGGTTSVEFTSGATVNMDVNSVAIGSDNSSIFSQIKDSSGNVIETIYSYVVGHILMSGEGTTVNLTGDWVFSMNYKYLKIADSAVVNVTATSEAISLGSWKNAGGNLIVTSDAVLNITLTEEAEYSGIATYGTSHYIEFSDGAKVTISGGENSTGMTLSRPTTAYVSDATLIIENANGIEANGADSEGSLLYEDSLSHIEATTVSTSDGGELDFIVMGGTLTYDFASSNVWPYNTLNPSIGSIADDAYGVNEVDPARSITYDASEALVNFIVPNNTAHCSFSAYGWNGNNAVTYDYISDTDKEEDTLSIWVPGVKIYYNVDEDSEYTTLQGVTLTSEEAKKFLLQADVPLNYDVVIRGQSINFSVNADGNSQYALPAVTNGSLENYTGTARALYYPATVTTSDGSIKYISWFYNKTTDYGPLTSFSKSGNVVRGSLTTIAVANVYGILSDTEPAAEESPEIDKTATSLDENKQTTVSLTIGAGSEKENVAVLFLLDKSTSTAVKQAATEMLKALAEKENTNILYDVVVFSGTADSSGWTSDLTLNDDNVATTFVNRKQTSGTNMSAGILQAIEDMQTLAEDYPEYDKTYLVTVSDGITYYWSVSGDKTAYAVAVQAYGTNGNIENEVQTGTDTWAMMYSYGTSIANVYGSFGTFLNSISVKMAETTGYGAVVSVGTSASTPLSTYIYDLDKKAEVAAEYACGPEFALYYSAIYYKELLTYFDYSYAFAMPETTSDGSDNETNWANYPWGKELMQYCQSLSTNSNWALSYSNDDAATIFESILDEILYQIASGTITDVIGADFTLTDAGAITDSTFSLTVDGVVAAVTDVSGNVVTFNNGDFILTYYQGTTANNGDGTYTITATDGTTYTYSPCDTIDEINGAVSDEFFTLKINVPIGALELTYSLTLTSSKTADGSYTVPTNETAVLEYTSSDGTEGEEEYPEPTVVYVVENPTGTTETEDPEDPEETTDTEETETTETTVVSEVVSAVTGDNAPIGVAILIAAVSEFTLLILIFLQMGKKKNNVI